MDARQTIDAVAKWAAARSDVLGLALVGSHARGEARADSDVDFVVVCADPARYLANAEWVSAFGDVASASFEDWGKVQSIRVRYQRGPEVEFGIAGMDWTAVPPDEGTAEVLRAGCIVLFDGEGLIERVRRSACDAAKGMDGG
jgi:aminoglycoside 6-adenylyltransferase